MIHTNYTRILINLLTATSLLLLFGSWNTSVYHLTLFDRAGTSAFRISVTHGHLNNQNLNYVATTGYLQTSQPSRQSNAYIFYTAYAVNNKAKRPVTFVFNGGPGSSSIWLHMGAMGPLRIGLKTAGYQENINTWLPFTDLVFIDPVGTGYSKAADGVDEHTFHSYQQDIRSIGRFVKSYLQSNNLQDRPVFLAGESYGAARAVGLAVLLTDSIHIPVAGLTLISPALNYQGLSFINDNQVPYITYLPTYALAAQYHQRLSSKLQSVSPSLLLQRAATFANGVYKRFIYGNKLVTTNILDSLHEYTGLNTGYLRHLNGRITDHQFASHLIPNEKIGIFDSRITGEEMRVDPSEQQLRKAFPLAFNDYVNNVLNYHNLLPYQVTISVKDWDYDDGRHERLLNVVPKLRQLLARHPSMTVHIACGIYDLATPVAANLQIAKQLSAQFDSQITMQVYEGGHMLYVDDQINKRFFNHAEEYYQRTLSSKRLDYLFKGPLLTKLVTKR